MAYAYDRSAEPGYENVPDYTSNHSSEHRDSNPSLCRDESASTSKTDRMTTSSTEPAGHDSVPAEIIQQITERVRKEGLQN